MVTALILSGGTGTRLGGDIPKQYINVNGKMIISYCIETLSANSKINAIQIVAAPAWRDELSEEIKKVDCGGKFYGFSDPGDTRQLSIYNGITDIRTNIQDVEYVFVHDAARPLISQMDIDSIINAAMDCDGSIPTLPMKDTVYLSDDGEGITGLLDRSKVFAGQAPEVFKLDKYISANERLIIRGEDNAIMDNSPIYKVNGSTEPAIMAGMNIAMIPGNENNYKITTRTDLDRFIKHVNGEI